MNLSDQPTDVNVIFYPDTGSPFFISKTVQPFRRGGLDVGQLPSIPDGLYSIQIASTHPIVAALSQYRFAPARAATETGVVGAGSTRGVIPGATIATVGQ